MELRFRWVLGIPLALLGARAVFGAPNNPAQGAVAGRTATGAGGVAAAGTPSAKSEAATSGTAAGTEWTSSGEPGTVTIRNSPQGQFILDDKKGVARMTRDVRVTQVGEDFILYADDLTYNKPRNQAIATGSLRVETRDSTIRAKRLFADFNQKTITFYDEVVISAHGERDGIQGTRKGFRSEILHKSSVLNCDRAVWDYELREGKATGNIVMKQGQNVGTCERITFNERQNVALMEGMVRFSDGKRRTLSCNDLTVFIDADKVESRQPCTVRFPREGQPSPTPGPTKAPARDFGPAPEISAEDLKAFELQDPAPNPARTKGATPGTGTASGSTKAPAASPTPEKPAEDGAPGPSARTNNSGSKPDGGNARPDN